MQVIKSDTLIEDRAEESLIRTELVQQDEKTKEITVLQQCKKNLLAGVQESVKLIVPTVVVTTVVMVMLYQPYKSMYHSVHQATESFEGMNRSFEDISRSMKEGKNSFENAKIAFEGIEKTFTNFNENMRNVFERVDASWIGCLVSSKK